MLTYEANFSHRITETDRQETEIVQSHTHNNRRIKELKFGRMDGTNRRGRPHREWLDDITEWGKASFQELS